MTTANKITIARILLVPLFIVLVLYYVKSGVEWFRFWAILCFVSASIADGLDGYVARHYNQRSVLGAILDPLADKMLLVSAIVLLSLDTHSHFEQIPLWFTAIIIGRDVIILIGMVVIYLIARKVNVRPRIFGKIATVFQMCLVSWTLLQWDLHVMPWLIGSAAAFTAISGFFYVMDGIHQLNAHPASGPMGGTKP